MKTKILTKEFFDFFAECPKKAIYSFYLTETLSDGFTSTRVDSSESFYRHSIVKKIFLVSFLYIRKTNKLDYITFNYIVKTVIKKAYEKKENELLEKSKKTILGKIELEDQKKIYEIIQSRDLINIKESSIRDVFSLDELLQRMHKHYTIFGTNYQFQKKFFYNFDLPIITEDGGQYNIIKFTDSDIKTESDILYDFDLSLTITIAREMFPHRIFKGIVLYNTKTLKRTYHRFNISKSSYIIEDLYKMMVIMDMGTSYRVHGKHCNKCLNMSTCLLNKIDVKHRKEIYHKSLKGKKNNEFEKRDIVKKYLKQAQEEIENY